MGNGTRTPESSTHSGRGAASSGHVASVADKVVGQKVEGLKMSEAKDNHPLYAAINVKLAEIAVASPTCDSPEPSARTVRPDTGLEDAFPHPPVGFQPAAVLDGRFLGRPPPVVMAATPRSA